MTDKEKNKDSKFVVLSICVLYVAIMQGLFIRPLYGPDMYNAMDDPTGYYNAALYGSGRFVHAFYFWFIAQIGQILSWISAYYVSYIFNLLFLILAIYRYANMTVDILSLKSSDVKGKIAVAVLSCITIDNVFISEYFLYPESIFVLVTWLNVEAVSEYWRWCKDKRKTRHIVIAFLLMLSGFGYQIIPCVYFVLTLPIIMMRSSNIRSFIENQLVTGIYYLLGVIPGSIFAKYIVDSPRVKFQHESISEKVYTYKPQTVDTKTFILDRIASGMWIYAVACCVIIVLLVVAASQNKEYYELLKGAYIVFVTIFVGLIPYIFGATDDYKPRIYYVLGTLLGVLIVYGLIKGYISIDYYRQAVVCVCVVVVMILVQYVNFSDIARERYMTNYEDKFISEMIGHEIDVYENKTDDSIKRVVFYQDSRKTKYINNKGWCLSMRAYGVEWGNISCLNFYLNRQYQNGTPDETIAKQFALKDWSEFSGEQIVFSGDTAHICRY